MLLLFYGGLLKNILQSPRVNIHILYPTLWHVFLNFSLADVIGSGKGMNDVVVLVIVCVPNF